MMEKHINSENDTIVSVSNLSKKYCRSMNQALAYGVKDTIREFFFNLKVDRELRKDEFWALKDISFELKAGESLAIIGENGAGKSTLLKILYGLIKPDRGEVRIRGKVGALVELGTGFERTLSGRENIYYNARLLGFPESEIGGLVDKVLSFSELGEFIDTPVQYYSSGMVARLAYSITSNMNPSLFLVDEVLVVGDLNFQRKCINHMLNYLSTGGSLILVSHSPFHVQSVCQRGIYLKDNHIAYSGSALEALGKYHEDRLSQNHQGTSNQGNVVLTDENPLMIEEVTINSIGNDLIKTHDKVKISIKYQSIKPLEDTGFAFMISSQDDLICITGDININSYKINRGIEQVDCVINDFPLLSGTYLLKFTIYQTSNYWVYANVGYDNPALKFEVVNSELNLSSSTSKMLNQLVALNTEWNAPTGTIK